MRAVLCFLLFCPLLCLSQTDSLKRRNFSFEFIIPFGGGLSYTSGNHTGPLPYHSEFFLNHDKKVAGEIQAFKFQVFLYRRWFVETEFSYVNLGVKNKEVLAQFRESEPGYFIQGEGKYDDVVTGYTDTHLNYWSSGAGMNFKAGKKGFLQPALLYCYGKASLPGGKYAFKDNTSNAVFVNEYNFEKLHMNGYKAALTYKTYGEFDEPMKNWMVQFGLGIEYTNLHVNGTGTVTITDNREQESVTTFNAGKRFNSLSLVVFLGFASR